MRLGALTLALAAAALLPGCGGSEGAGETTTAPGDRLTVYTALPLQGPGAERARDVLDGERLALEQAGDRAGDRRLELRPVSDAAPEDGWQPGLTVDAARAAAEDPSTIAFIGDFDAGATALSLPTTNEAGILQVSPGATYDGFTGGPGSIPGEPDKYRPSGVASFGRIPPADAVQARAIVDVLEERGCRRVAVLSAPNAFEASLADLIAEEAARAGLRVMLREQVRPDPEAHADAAEEVLAAMVDCAALAAGPGDLPAALLQALHAAAPDLRVVAGLNLADAGVARQLGDAAATTEIVGPPPAGERLRAAFRRAHGREPGPWAAYGHEAMRRVLDVIKGLGEAGADRAAVTRAYLERFEPTAALALWRGGPEGLELVRQLPPA
ncbi:MAG TPA: ABC transporter substrate-binding protein [Capillimicrobium sp.]